MGREKDHIYSYVSPQNCPGLDVTEFTSTYADGFCKIYLPKEAFMGGDVRVTIRSLDSPSSADTTEQVLHNELTPAIFPVYSYSSYTFSLADDSCPASAEQTLFCVPPAEQTSVLSTEAIAILYVLYDLEIKRVLRTDLPVRSTRGSGHCLGFFDGIFPEHNVLSTLLSHALSSQFGRLNLAFIRFLQPGPATTGYWARALGDIDDFDVVSKLFSSTYTATLRKREDEDGGFRLVLVVADEDGDIVVSMESQPYRPPHLAPLTRDDVRYESTGTLGTGMNVYLRRKPGVVVLFNYFSQPGRGSSRGPSCLDYLDILGQHCTSYSSGYNLCPVQSKLSKNDVLNAIAEQPIYLSTAEGEGDWTKLFTLETGDMLNVCGYWMIDQPTVAITEEGDGAIYFSNKSRPSPLTFFLLVTAGCFTICMCVIMMLLCITSFCACLRLYAVDLRWSPHRTPVPESPGELKKQVELQRIGAETDTSVACVSPLPSKAMSPLLLPRGDAAKKLASKQNQCTGVALAIAGATTSLATGSPLSDREHSSVTRDTIYSSISAGSMASSMVCAPPTDSTAVHSEDKQDMDTPAVSGSLA